MTSVPTTHPPHRGAKRWRNCCYEYPLFETLVEVWRCGWAEAEVVDWRKIDPATNIHGLYWCPLSKPVLEPEARHAD